MKIPPLKEMVSEGRKAHFRYYRDNALWYEAENGFMFQIPISDTGTATFKDTEKAIYLMRWIRKHIAELQAEAAEAGPAL